MKNIKNNLLNLSLVGIMATFISLGVYFTSQTEPQNSKGIKKSNLEQKLTAADEKDKIDQCIIVSKNAGKYHLPNCKYMETILATNVKTYLNTNIAKKEGYAPCEVCFPTNSY